IEALENIEPDEIVTGKAEPDDQRDPRADQRWRHVVVPRPDAVFALDAGRKTERKESAPELGFVDRSRLRVVLVGFKHPPLHRRAVEELAPAILRNHEIKDL